MSDADAAGAPTVFERVGGLAAFERLVASFYGRVAVDPLLRPIYPDDLAPAERHLGMFLAQYFGGGQIYSDARGHPRLRMRHAPFAVTPDAALRWATLMSAAVREQGWPEDAEREVLTYVARATPTLVNTVPATPEGLPVVGDDRA